MNASPHCPLCGDSFPPGVLLCPNDHTARLVAPPLQDETVIPTNVDIKLPFEPENAAKPTPPKPFVVEPGTIIGEYVIEKKIGQGGMGEIWRGSQPLIKKQVAVKILRGKIASDPDSIERFLREAKSVNAIKHKSLIDIFSFGELPDKRPYFVMEFLQGQSLLAYINEKGPLSWTEILQIFGQLCEALEATHQQGIIHRDLKSDNLFLVKEPHKSLEVKVLDFGLAKLIDPEQEDAKLTQDGFVFGTPAYMAPEQCKGTTSPLSDIYSLGTILFETITGRTPFAESWMKATEVMFCQLADPAPAPSSMVVGRTVPVEVDALVLQLLEKDPAKRPQSCSILAQMIKAIIGPLAKEETPATIAAKPVFFSEAQLQLRRKNKKPWVWPAALFFLLVFVGAWTVVSRPQPVPTSFPVVQVQEIITEVPVPAAKPETIQIKITTEPSDAKVYIGEEFVGLTPLEQPFPYREEEALLSLQKEGFQTHEEKISLKEVTRVGVSLRPIEGKVKPKSPDKAKKEEKPIKIDKEGTAPDSLNPFSKKSH